MTFQECRIEDFTKQDDGRIVSKWIPERIRLERDKWGYHVIVPKGKSHYYNDFKHLKPAMRLILVNLCYDKLAYIQIMNSLDNAEQNGLL